MIINFVNFHNDAWLHVNKGLCIKDTIELTLYFNFKHITECQVAYVVKQMLNVCSTTLFIYEQLSSNKVVRFMP